MVSLNLMCIQWCPGKNMRMADTNTSLLQVMSEGHKKIQENQQSIETTAEVVLLTVI